jgi:hypothetical protein
MMKADVEEQGTVPPAEGMEASLKATLARQKARSLRQDSSAT